MNSLVLFFNDLRLDDNPALTTAVKKGEPFFFLYVFDKEENMGPPQRWWLQKSLEQLDRQLHGLHVIEGTLKKVIPNFIEKHNITHVFWNRSGLPKRDQELANLLKNLEVESDCFDANLLVDPEELFNRSGKPYRVFGQFWKTAQKEVEDLSRPLPKPKIPFGKKGKTAHLTIGSSKKQDREGWEATWDPGEEGAKKQWASFQKQRLPSYRIERDRPDTDTTSRLSPHLHFGEITVRRLVYDLFQKASSSALDKKNREKFFSELGWREFSYYLLFHFPTLPEKNFDQRFDSFPWKKNRKWLDAWKHGETGYPIVDAGMRQLLSEGWIHNRVRMIVASFLTKDLQLHWLEGAAWFLETLVDADLANNSASWQWVAGCGADAAPFFRIFNPVLQGETFDPDGEYVRCWVPELENLPKKKIHAPWEMTEEEQEEYGVVLGKTYPFPIVNHREARQKALDAFSSLKKKSR